MPPNLDIYGLTRRRDLETINNFLECYIDREASEDRGNEELFLELLDPSVKLLNGNDYECEPAYTLSHVVQRGLDYPRRTFFIELKSNQPKITGVVLGFTSDNQLVIGLSIDDKGKQAENLERAKLILETLAEQYTCYLGLIMVEQPPPLSESEFREAAKDTLTEYFKEFSIYS